MKYLPLLLVFLSLGVYQCYGTCKRRLSFIPQEVFGVGIELFLYLQLVLVVVFAFLEINAWRGKSNLCITSLMILH